jgi:hypothetical protein
MADRIDGYRVYLPLFDSSTFFSDKRASGLEPADNV